MCRLCSRYLLSLYVISLTFLHDVGYRVYYVNNFAQIFKLKQIGMLTLRAVGVSLMSA